MENGNGQRLGIVGLGLLGGSVARAARARWPEIELTGWDHDAGVRARAVAAGLVDTAPDLLDGLSDAGFIVVSVPVHAVAGIIEQLARRNPAAIVTDVASSKQAVIDALGGCLPPGFGFVPAHPMAGGEQGGFGAARANLFEARSCLITPLPDTPAAACAQVEAFWRALGAVTRRTDPATHDRMVALTSHLPHLLAFALVEGLAADLADDRGGAATRRDNVAPFVGRSFAEQIRLASSDPIVWAHILEANAPELLTQLEALQHRLADWRATLAHAPHTVLARLLPTIEAARALAAEVPART